MGRIFKNPLMMRMSMGMGIGIFILIITGNLYLFRDFEHRTLDLRFYLRGKIEKGILEDIVIVDIDEESLAKLGRFQQWPRSYHAKIIEYIKGGGAKLIGFDIFFPEEDKNPHQDQLLAMATHRAGNVYHSMFFPTEGGRESPLMKRFSYNLRDIFPKREFISPPIDLLLQTAKGIGHVDCPLDSDGILRRVPLMITHGGVEYPSLGLQMALDYLEVEKEKIRLIEGKFIELGDKKIPIDERGTMLINYVGPANSFRYIPYHEVLRRRIPAEYFDGKIVLIGASATGLFDLKPTPFTSEYPGVEAHANIIHNIIHSHHLIKMDGWITICIASLLAILTSLATSTRLLKATILTILLLIGYLVVADILFEFKNVWIEMIKPTTVVFFCYIGQVAYRLLREERERRRIRSIFQRYVTREVVDEILSDPEKARLGGDRREITILFSDIRGFTSLSEALAPEEVVSILNEYLTAMTDVIFKYGGTLDKFIGDAIMAIYGAPVACSDHAERAVRTAVEMQEQLKELGERWKRDGRKPIQMGIGINTGEAVVGNIGSTMRMEYTTIGDNVNLASRIESLTTGGQILISKSTYHRVKDIVKARELKPVRVKGKSELVEVYEVEGLRD